MPEDNLKQLAEDAYLLASSYHTGNDEYLLEAVNQDGLNEDDKQAFRHFRMVEMVVALGDRAAALAGLDPQTDVWVPTDLKEMVG